MCQTFEAQGVEEEDELLERARAGDFIAFEALVTRHRDRVYGLALRLLNSTEAAAEVTQRAFLAAHGRLGGFSAEDDFGRWVRHAAAQEAVSELRGRRGRPGPASAFEDSTGPAVAGADFRRGIEVATASLTDECREVFVLRDLEGVAFEEIAELTRASVPVLKGRLHRARLSLKGAIQRLAHEHR